MTETNKIDEIIDDLFSYDNSELNKLRDSISKEIIRRNKLRQNYIKNAKREFESLIKKSN